MIGGGEGGLEYIPYCTILEFRKENRFHHIYDLKLSSSTKDWFKTLSKRAEFGGHTCDRYKYPTLPPLYKIFEFFERNIFRKHD